MNKPPDSLRRSETGLLAVYCLMICDSYNSMLTIGKKTVLKKNVVKKKVSFNFMLGNVQEILKR